MEMWIFSDSCTPSLMMSRHSFPDALERMPLVEA